MHPQSINNKGEIVGRSTHGDFFYRDGHVRYFAPVSEPHTAYLFTGINDRGVVAGLKYNLSRDLRYPHNIAPFILATSGVDRDLNFDNATIPPAPGFYAHDINDHGILVGDDLAAFPARAAVIYPHGELRHLPGLMPDGLDTAVGINKHGQVVGTAAVEPGIYRPVIWSEGRVQNLGILPGFLNAEGTAINDHGHVVGFCNNHGKWTGFIYRDGAMSELAGPHNVGIFFPTHITNAGDVLFASRSGQNGRWWLYSNGVLHDLSRIVQEAAESPTWVSLYSIYDMNDRGEIIGIVEYPYDEAHPIQGFLMVPVNKPN